MFGSPVFAASDFSVFPLDRSAGASTATNLLKSPEESYLLGLVKTHLDTAPFYFTYGGYSLATRLQEQKVGGADKPFWQQVRAASPSATLSSELIAAVFAGGRSLLLEPAPPGPAHQRYHRRR